MQNTRHPLDKHRLVRARGSPGRSRSREYNIGLGERTGAVRAASVAVQGKLQRLSCRRWAAGLSVPRSRGPDETAWSKNRRVRSSIWHATARQVARREGSPCPANAFLFVIAVRPRRSVPGVLLPRGDDPHSWSWTTSTPGWPGSSASSRTRALVWVSASTWTCGRPMCGIFAAGQSWVHS